MCGGSCAARRQTSGCLLIRPAGREPLTGSPPGYPVAPSPCAPTLILWRVQWGHLSLEVVIAPLSRSNLSGFGGRIASGAPFPSPAHNVRLKEGQGNASDMRQGRARALPALRRAPNRSHQGARSHTTTTRRSSMGVAAPMNSKASARAEPTSPRSTIMTRSSWW